LKTGDDWVLTIKDTGDTLTIHDIANNNVDSFVFENGKSYTADEINKALITHKNKQTDILQKHTGPFKIYSAGALSPLLIYLSFCYIIILIRIHKKE